MKMRSHTNTEEEYVDWTTLSIDFEVHICILTSIDDVLRLFFSRRAVSVTDRSDYRSAGRTCRHASAFSIMVTTERSGRSDVKT